MKGNAPSHPLRSLSQKARRGAAKNQEPSRPPRTIRQDAESLEECGHALHLIQHNETPEGLERQHRVSHPGEVAWVLEIERVD
jgi:hypothetical protein